MAEMDSRTATRAQLQSIFAWSGCRIWLFDHFCQDKRFVLIGVSPRVALATLGMYHACRGLETGESVSERFLFKIRWSGCLRSSETGYPSCERLLSVVSLFGFNHRRKGWAAHGLLRWWLELTLDTAGCLKLKPC